MAWHGIIIIKQGRQAWIGLFRGGRVIALEARNGAARWSGWPVGWLELT
jgi:hypothetical protein